ncbi:MAG: hypothetical protein JEY91_14310 [Spirochaetaceae bacterium]|nr:hypothetical protein [Spirochaetaceae bacterium]
MKKILLYMVILIGLSITACDSDINGAIDDYDNFSLTINGSDSTFFIGTVGENYPIMGTLSNSAGSTQEITVEDLAISDSETEIYRYDNGVLKIIDQGTEILTATYGSETVEIEIYVDEYVRGDLRAISPADLERRAVSYSGYREGDSPDIPEYPSEAEITEDLALLKQAGFGLLRLYDSGTHALRTLNVIKNTYPDDFKVMLGVWITEATPDENWVQTTSAIDFMNTGGEYDFSDIIVAVSVGNECTVDWNTWAPADPSTIRKFVQYIRENVSQPVTTDDNFAPYSGGSPKSLEVAKVVDFLAIHTYPALDTAYALANSDVWKCLDTPEAERAAAMNAWAVARAKDEYNQVRTAMDGKGLTELPIVIGETGWKYRVASQNLMVNRAHPVNASMYYNSMVDWIYGTGRSTNPDPVAAATEGPMALFYFEAFDEPWKQGDDGWGLFEISR